MTNLSVSAMTLLRACAQAMARREDDKTLDLHTLYREFTQDDALVAFLTKEVEANAEDRLTVRRVSKELAASSVATMGPELKLGVCPKEDAPDIITELDAEVTLYSVGPYGEGDGLRILG